jgi:hypothetical protein
MPHVALRTFFYEMTATYKIHNQYTSSFHTGNRNSSHVLATIVKQVDICGDRLPDYQQGLSRPKFLKLIASTECV